MRSLISDLKELPEECSKYDVIDAVISHVKWRSKKFMEGYGSMEGRGIYPEGSIMLNNLAKDLEKVKSIVKSEEPEEDFKPKIGAWGE